MEPYFARIAAGSHLGFRKLGAGDGTWIAAFSGSRALPGARNVPGDAVLYSIRHAAISEMLSPGLDPLSVARLSGTSVEMISKHYGHLVQDHVRKQLAQVRVL